ncbi:hypothetical protein LCGC14_2418950, partial [marine sediment metagenome]
MANRRISDPSRGNLVVGGTVVVQGDTTAIPIPVSGSVGISSATVNVGTVDVDLIVGSVHIEGTPTVTVSSGTLNHVTGVGTISNITGGVIGTVSSVSSGSVGILDQPISVQGTIGISNPINIRGTPSDSEGQGLGTRTIQFYREGDIIGNALPHGIMIFGIDDSPIGGNTLTTIALSNGLVGVHGSI